MTHNATRLAHRGRGGFGGLVNPPICRGSTILSPDFDSFVSGAKPHGYGRLGSPTNDALAEVLLDLEGPSAAGIVLTSSGLSAIMTAMMSAVKSGDHMLVTDSTYGPTRELCTSILARGGVEVTFYDPMIGAGIAALMRPNTRAVYLEAPGSQTFEIQDVDAIAAIAKAHGARVLMDNTWATPLFFRPLEHGVDIAIQSGTKYVCGHSDALIGIAAANEAALPALRDTHRALGQYLGPDDAYLGLRGLRTMEMRLRQHEQSALALADWLAGQNVVARVLHPAMPDHPGHAIWRRDFSGSSGVFAFLTRPAPIAAVRAMFDGMRLFGIGLSFGGFESLMTYADVTRQRTATTWLPDGHLIRLQIGLEHRDDLIADLSAGLGRFRLVSDDASRTRPSFETSLRASSG